MLFTQKVSQKLLSSANFLPALRNMAVSFFSSTFSRRKWSKESQVRKNLSKISAHCEGLD